ncbi:MAG: histidine kinase, partial [Mariprofundaceae bacterium]
RMRAQLADVLRENGRMHDALRHDLAGWLHDELAQGLVAVRGFAHAARQAIERGDGEQAAGLLDELGRLVREQAGGVRERLVRLRPMFSRELGFAEEVRRMLRDWAEHCGLPCQMACEEGHASSLDERDERELLACLSRFLEHAARLAGLEALVLHCREDGIVVEMLGDGLDLASMRAEAVELRERLRHLPDGAALVLYPDPWSDAADASERERDLPMPTGRGGDREVE